VVAAVGVASPSAAELGCSDIPELTSMYFRKHIKFRDLTPELRRRTIEIQLRGLDPQRVLFLEPEVAELEQQLDGLFNETETGDCSRLGRIQQDVVKRHKAAEDFIRKFVGNDDYILDEDAALVLDPEDRGHPATREEQEALLKSLAHFQISNYLGADTELPEARRRLIHRYELRTRRAQEVEQAELYASFLDAFSQSLDPHSRYFSAEFFEEFRIQMQLSLEGIGVALSEEDGYAVVQEIIPGGAAERIDALKPQDKIIAVSEDEGEAVDVIDMALRDVVKLIRGKKGTRVHLTVLRREEKTERFTVAIVRDKIDLDEKAAQIRFEEVEQDGRKLKLAILELPAFYGDGDGDPSKRLASRDVLRLLEEAKREEADGLLLDLSRNGGGLLDDAVRISGFFIRKGGIVAVRDTNDRTRVHQDPDDSVVWPGPMVVLTSRISASASEILAGAMKDYGRAVVVGDDHTFGKGTVQSMIPLGRRDLGALKVTTGLFFRPGGHSTQHEGVSSDVVLPSLLADERIGESANENSLPSEEIQAFRSPAAQGRNPREVWTPVREDLLAELARRSQVRAAEDIYFQEIVEKLAEREKDDGIVTVAELVAEREEAEADEPGDGIESGTGGTTTGESVAVEVEVEVEEDDDVPNPHVEEALRILADLVILSS